VALGDDPAASVAAPSDTVIALVANAAPEATIGGPARTMTLAASLPSRIAELTIQGLDILGALGAELAAPPPAPVQSLALVSRWSMRKGTGEMVLFALTGRGQLPAGYSVY
jgi:hypothetical protein